MSGGYLTYNHRQIRQLVDEMKTKYLANMIGSGLEDFSTWEGFGLLWSFAQKQIWWFEFTEAVKGIHLAAFIDPERFAHELYAFHKNKFGSLVVDGKVRDKYLTEAMCEIWDEEEYYDFSSSTAFGKLYFWCIQQGWWNLFQKSKEWDEGNLASPSLFADALYRFLIRQY